MFNRNVCRNGCVLELALATDDPRQIHSSNSYRSNELQAFVEENLAYKFNFGRKIRRADDITSDCGFATQATGLNNCLPGQEIVFFQPISVIFVLVVCESRSLCFS